MKGRDKSYVVWRRIESSFFVACRQVVFYVVVRNEVNVSSGSGNVSELITSRLSKDQSTKNEEKQKQIGRWMGMILQDSSS